jgi:acyl-CoA dehydrogenase
LWADYQVLNPLSGTRQGQADDPFRLFEIENTFDCRQTRRAGNANHVAGKTAERNGSLSSVGGGAPPGRSNHGSTSSIRRGEITVDFEYSSRTKALLERLDAFMDEWVYPNEEKFHQEVATGDRWQPTKIMESLKLEARKVGLWNLFLPESELGAGLTNLEYAPLCERMGRVEWSPEVFNCSAPDTGNMEVLVRYGTPAQKKEWLESLMDGRIRSCFAMTEPDVASSDATNIRSTISREGDEYVVNGRKWWSSGAMDPRCKVFIFMGQSDPDNADRHKRQSMIVVPRETRGVTVKRYLPVFGFDDAPHGHAELLFEDVRVPASSILLGEGRGFEIAQGRLGPGRIHHCMRLIGLAERALEKMCRRTASRTTFGKPVSERTVTLERIAESRILIDQTRLLVLNAADRMDKVGNKGAAREIAMIKVAAPNMACKVIDWAIQAHGGGGVTTDFGLASAYANARTLRLADGPDEVHRNQIGKLELRRHTN